MTTDALISYGPRPSGSGHEITIAAFTQEAVDTLLGSHTIRVPATDGKSIEHAFTFIRQLQDAGLNVRFTTSPGA